MCDAIDRVTNGRVEYCNRTSTEERKILPPKKYAQIPTTRKFCSYHATLHDIHERK